MFSNQGSCATFKTIGLSNGSILYPNYRNFNKPLIDLYKVLYCTVLEASPHPPPRVGHSVVDPQQNNYPSGLLPWPNIIICLHERTLQVGVDRPLAFLSLLPVLE
jgi:hypothetical protein